jgi:hypothetical protein
MSGSFLHDGHDAVVIIMLKICLNYNSGTGCGGEGMK